MNTRIKGGVVFNSQGVSSVDKLSTVRDSYRLILFAWALAFGYLLASNSVHAQVAVQIPGDPIATSGHGVLYAQGGSKIEVDFNFIDEALNFYTGVISASATIEQQTQYDEFLNILTQDDWGQQGNLIVRLELLKWFYGEVDSPEKVVLRRRIGALNNELQLDLSADNRQKYEVPANLQTLIDATIPRTVVLAFSTTTRDEEYINECRAAGVPIPPAWGEFGPDKWVQRGILTNNQEFIDFDREAEVYTFETDAPDGVCIALPRANDDDNDGVVQDPDDVISPLGIICIGRITSNVCFWDATSEGERFDINKGEVVPLSEFAGGVELNIPNAFGQIDVCTECHAGENPFTIHPGSALDQQSITYNAAEWYNPIVPQSWPQNAGPANNIDTIPGIANCTGCHREGDEAGRLPQLSSAIGGGYCGTVLSQAVMGAKATMPQGNPGSQANSSHVADLLALCQQAPTEILRYEDTDINYGDVEIGFAFTKPILIHNDGNAPLTVNSITLTTPAGSPALSQFDITEVAGIALPFTIQAGDPPLTALVTFNPTANGLSEISYSIETSGASGAVDTQNIRLRGNGVPPTPIESILVLDRSGSMSQDAGDRNKIRAARDAANIFMDLLRPPVGDFVGDSMGLVKYNANNSVYLPLQVMTQVSKDNISNDQLEDAALQDIARLEPDGRTGIGGAMQTAANMIGATDASKHQVMVVMTDGEENETPFIGTVLPLIEAANDQMQLYSIGLGDSIEPDKLQSITNQGDEGFHQVTGTLEGFSIFDLEAFYFKIFANSAGMELAVDPTHLVNLLQPGTVVVDTATVVTSDKSATFIVLEDPVLRSFYDLKFESPQGQIIQVGSQLGGIPVQVSRRHTYTIYKVIFPDIAQANTYVGEWKLLLTPNGSWTKSKVRSAIADSHLDYTHEIQPLFGHVPIGFAAAVGSDYRLDVDIQPKTLTVGTKIDVFGELTDRFWPSVDGDVTVEITLPNGSKRQMDLVDDATANDVVAGDGVWTNRFTDTAQAGVYKFYFQSNGRNLRGELAPREETRYVTLEKPEHDDGQCNENEPCFKLRLELQQLTKKLEQAILSKDESGVKEIYEDIRTILKKHPECAEKLEPIEKLYELLLEAFFNGENDKARKILQKIYELLDSDNALSNCDDGGTPTVCKVPDLKAPCAEFKLRLESLTLALERAMDKGDKREVKRIYEQIQRYLSKNKECADKLKPLDELFEKAIGLFFDQEFSEAKNVLAEVKKQLFLKYREVECNKCKQIERQVLEQYKLLLTLLNSSDREKAKKVYNQLQKLLEKHGACSSGYKDLQALIKKLYIASERNSSLEELDQLIKRIFEEFASL